jgi:hypothetical protein
MPRGKRSVVPQLPATFRVSYLGGEKFVEIKAAAKLAGIHPAILEMGQRLLKAPGRECGVFQLGTEELQKRSAELRAMFVTGLKKVARAFAPAGMRVQSHATDDRLTFWYEQGKPWGKKPAAAA